GEEKHSRDIPPAGKAWDRVAKDLPLRVFVSSWFKVLFPSLRRLRRRPSAAIIRVGAHEDPSAFVVGDDLIEKGLARAADGAALVPALDREGMVLEVEALDRGQRRHGVDALLASGAEELERRVHVHLGIVEFGDR